MRRSILHIGQILEWADAHYGRTGNWPEKDSGQVWETADEKWGNIDGCLRVGLRGLRPGGSLARLLAKHRGKRNRKALPKYTIPQILKWADAHHSRSGRWPHHNDGSIVGASGETWLAVDMALRNGIRGLRGGSSLAKLLHAKRRVPNRLTQPRLSLRQILQWIDAHHERTGNWPTLADGRLADAPHETWCGIDHALKKGSRGLREHSSLARLLAKHRQVHRHVRRRPLSHDEILQWADAWFERTGKWPRQDSGPIPEAPGETWQRVQSALLDGKRGLPGGETLTRFVATRRMLRTKVTLPTLTKGQILHWARCFHNRHGYWPTRKAGLIPQSHGETWSAIENGLKHGGRGLQGGTTLSQLIRRKFGIRVSRLKRPKGVAGPSCP
jgi:hypothetical protein